MKWLRHIRIALLIVLVGPPLMMAGSRVNMAADWRTASRESANIAPSPAATREAVVQVYGARAFGWRGVFAIHTWIAVKPEAATTYTTYQVIGWRAFRGGSALVIGDDLPDRHWFGSRPEVLADLRGAAAAKAIVAIERAVAAYPYRDTYRTWPGPNSNTFTAYVGRAVPELALDLPPTAIGKDFLANGAIVARAPSGTGVQLSLYGLVGVLIAAEEGLEINLFGLAFGIDPKDLALRLPGLGKLGF